MEKNNVVRLILEIHAYLVDLLADNLDIDIFLVSDNLYICILGYICMTIYIYVYTQVYTGIYIYTYMTYRMCVTAMLSNSFCKFVHTMWICLLKFRHKHVCRR